MGDCRRYTDNEALSALTGPLANWQVVDGHLVRDYRTSGWRSSMMVTNAIAHLAEVAWHHPDLMISWGGVGVRLRTHSDDAITDKDLELAELIETVVAWQPSDRGALEGTPKDGEWSYLLND